MSIKSFHYNINFLIFKYYNKRLVYIFLCQEKQDKFEQVTLNDFENKKYPHSGNSILMNKYIFNFVLY